VATLESGINIREDVLFRDLGGEAVILNLKTGKYYGLDEVGTRMWSLLTHYGRVEPAYRALLEEYDVTEDRLQRDLLSFIDNMASHGLLEIDET